MRAEAGKDGVVHWKGALTGSDHALRRITAGILALACVTLAFTQLGFFGMMLADGSTVYLVIMLAPVALAALLLGTLSGTCLGLFAGLVLYLHAVLMPLDYYELTYVTPITSIVMIGVCSLVLSVLFALVIRRCEGGRRIAFLVLACLVASMVFSAGFAIGAVSMLSADMLAEFGLQLEVDQLSGVQEQAVKAALFSGNMLVQVLGDALLMAIVSLVGLVCAERGRRAARHAGLRALFGVRLSVLVFAVFLVSATAAYVSITASELAEDADDMRSEVSYMLGQIDRADELNGKVFEALLKQNAENIDELIELLSSGGTLANQFDGYSEKVDGLIVASYYDTIVGADVDRVKPGDSLRGFLGDDVLAAADRSEANGTIERVVYLAPSSDDNVLIDALPDVVLGDSGDRLVPQVCYLMAMGEADGHRTIMIRPAGMIFADRTDVLAWVTLASVLLLLAALVLAQWLLDVMVARRIDATNAALARITAGDLESRVEPRGTREFLELSKGINTTVDALNGWIDEAEARMDAELAAAKAVQESALPRTFPAFPNIPSFDIFASMDAAKEVGGDFYDFFLVGDASGSDSGNVAFIMADVSGKGMPAALFMMKAKALLREAVESGAELGEAVAEANRELVEGNDAGMFVTAWVGVLDYGTGRVDYVNAGHNPPLLRHNGGWEWLTEKSGLPLGLFDMPYEAYHLDCESGDAFLLYTDGVTEAYDVDKALYGEDRLLDVVGKNASLSPHGLVKAVRADVAIHAEGAVQSDDVTILVLELTADATPRTAE